MAIDTGILTNIAFYVSLSIVFAILALGFNIQWGYTGLFNAGVAGFFLIGAYTAAIAITPPSPPIIIGGAIVYPGHLGGFQLPFVVGALLAMIVSGATAALIAIPTLRLRADYLAIATIAFAEIVRIFAINLESVTGGTIGIILIPRPVTFNPPDPFLIAVTMVAIGGAILLALIFILQFMAESPWGRVLRATRDDEEAAMALGKNTFRYKLQAFALGGALMGLAGAMFAVTLVYIEPAASFAPAITFSVWVMVIVGGSGNNRGAIMGAFLVYGMEWLSVQLKDFAPAGPAALPPEAQRFAALIALVGVLVTLMALLYILGGWGLLRRRRWAWWLTVIVSIISIVSQLTQYALVPVTGFPYFVVIWIVILVYCLLVREAFMQTRGRGPSSSRMQSPSSPPALASMMTQSVVPELPTGVRILAALMIAFGVLALIGGLVILAASGFIVKDTIVYIRFMIIGVLLILLVLFRPEGILRERKRTLG